jgi:Hsp20/alpha crystallin family
VSSAEVKEQKEQKEGGRVIRSERYYGSMSRSFSLGQDVDEKTANAKCADGVLELTLPKKGRPSHVDSVSTVITMEEPMISAAVTMPIVRRLMAQSMRSNARSRRETSTCTVKEPLPIAFNSRRSSPGRSMASAAASAQAFCAKLRQRARGTALAADPRQEGQRFADHVEARVEHASQAFQGNGGLEQQRESASTICNTAFAPTLASTRRSSPASSMAASSRPGIPST